MSYPQPDSNSAVIQGQDFFRLNTKLSSPGDIYESEQSSHVACLGPESDLANVVVQYYDDQVPTFLQQATISQRRPFAGRMNARNDTRYSPTGVTGCVKGRVMFWPADLYDPNFKPSTFNAGVGDQMEFIVPQLDVIQYFQQIDTVPDRIDRQYLFQNYRATGTNFIVVPFYGRKLAYAQFTNRTPASSANFGIIGVNYAITDDATASPPPYHQETTLQAVTGVATNASITKIVSATANGEFDALVFSVQTSGPAILHITTSDND